MTRSPILLGVAGAVAAVGSLAAYMSLLAYPAIRNRPWLYVAGMVLGTGLAALGAARGRRWLTVPALGVCVVLLAAGVYLNFVMSVVPPSPTTLRVGQPAPDFTLTDASGRRVTLSDYRGRKPVVLVFYRGYW